MKTYEGFGQTKVAVGSVVKIHEPGFGRGLQAEIISVNEDPQRVIGKAEVRITHTPAKSCWQVGNRTTCGVWWLEAVK